MLVMGGPFITCCRRVHPSVSPPAESFSPFVCLEHILSLPCTRLFNFLFIQCSTFLYRWPAPLFFSFSCTFVNTSLLFSLPALPLIFPSLTIFFFFLHFIQNGQQFSQYHLKLQVKVYVKLPPWHQVILPTHLMGQMAPVARSNEENKMNLRYTSSLCKMIHLHVITF